MVGPSSPGLQSLLWAPLPWAVAANVPEHLPCARHCPKESQELWLPPPSALLPVHRPCPTCPSHGRRSHPGAQTGSPPSDSCFTGDSLGSGGSNMQSFCWELEGTVLWAAVLETAAEPGSWWRLGESVDLTCSPPGSTAVKCACCSEGLGTPW